MSVYDTTCTTGLLLIDAKAGKLHNKKQERKKVLMEDCIRFLLFI
jgi:hypothetical protein